MTIVSTGNVGIGTDNPATRLHVAGNAVIGSGTTSNGQITCNYITGGYGNAADNFHIDNHTNAGTMLINYTNERPVKLFNSGTTGSFLVYSNSIDPIFVSRNDFPTTGWISRIRLNNSSTNQDVFMGHYSNSYCYIVIGIFSHHTSMTQWNYLYLNCLRNHVNYLSVSGEKMSYGYNFLLDVLLVLE